MKKYHINKIFLAIVLIMIATTVVTFFNMSKVNNKSREIDQAWVPSMEVLGWLNGAVSDVPSLALQITLETDPKEMAKIENEKLNPLLKEIDIRCQEYEAKYITSSEERELYLVFKDQWQLYLRQLQEVMEADRNNQLSLANEKFKQSYPAWERANNTIAKLIELNNRGAISATKESAGLSLTTIKWIVFLNLLAILLSLRLAFRISSREMKDIANIISQINKKYKDYPTENHQKDSKQ
jgi:methyl-accepting chemotaxis protein